MVRLVRLFIAETDEREKAGRSRSGGASALGREAHWGVPITYESRETIVSYAMGRRLPFEPLIIKIKMSNKNLN